MVPLAPLLIVPLVVPLIVSISPEMNPVLIATAALFRSPPLSTTATVKPLSSGPDDAVPPVKVTVPLAVTAGGLCTVVSVLVSVAVLLPLLPSWTVQLMVRVVSAPPAVGSPFVGEKL